MGVKRAEEEDCLSHLLSWLLSQLPFQVGPNGPPLWEEMGRMRREKENPALCGFMCLYVGVGDLSEGFALSL
jgi:hypothetical protein